HHDHEQRGDVADAWALTYQVGVERGRQHELANRPTQESRGAEAAKALAEGEQESAEDGWQNQREHYAAQDGQTRSAEQLGRLLELRVDVADGAAYQHETEREVVERQRDGDGEQTVSEPVGGGDTCKRLEDTRRTADALVLEDGQPR